MGMYSVYICHIYIINYIRTLLTIQININFTDQGMAGCEGIIDGRNQEYMILTTYLDYQVQSATTKGKVIHLLGSIIISRQNRPNLDYLQ